MKKILLMTIVAFGLALTPSLAGADPDVGLHCPDHSSDLNVKIEANPDGSDQDAINTTILEEGVLVCVKAGTGNTWIIFADGETTLQEYLFLKGIIDGSGEQGKDVSYYVTYPDFPELVLVCIDNLVVSLTVDGAEELELDALVDVEIGDSCGVKETTTTTEPTTTTTEPPVTTTTQPVALIPPVVVEAPAPAPVSAPTTQTTLPRTGASDWLILIGLVLFGLGGSLWFSSRLIPNSN